jgi:glyoxylase-like metal-dependent hydrolase (beta-lactamase superfamily II)
MLKIQTITLGPVQTNSYLLGDEITKDAVIIDPAWDGKRLAAASDRNDWRVTSIWLTHAHFDHIAGATELIKVLDGSPAIALHPTDLPLYQAQGGALLFGIKIDSPPAPGFELIGGQILSVGSFQFEVRHTPGHTPGHVIFYCAAERVAFCGDVIFNGSIGRTDLPGGSYDQLISSIHAQILTLPDDTILYCGHGPATTVGVERSTNPYLA